MGDGDSGTQTGSGGSGRASRRVTTAADASATQQSDPPRFYDAGSTAAPDMRSPASSPTFLAGGTVIYGGICQGIDSQSISPDQCWRAVVPAQQENLPDSPGRPARPAASGQPTHADHLHLAPAERPQTEDAASSWVIHGLHVGSAPTAQVYAKVIAIPLAQDFHSDDEAWGALCASDTVRWFNDRCPARLLQPYQVRKVVGTAGRPVANAYVYLRAAPVLRPPVAAVSGRRDATGATSYVYGCYFRLRTDASGNVGSQVDWLRYDGDSGRAVVTDSRALESELAQGPSSASATGPAPGGPHNVSWESYPPSGSQQAAGVFVMTERRYTIVHEPQSAGEIAFSRLFGLLAQNNGRDFLYQPTQPDLRAQRVRSRLSLASDLLIYPAAPPEQFGHLSTALGLLDSLRGKLQTFHAASASTQRRQTASARVLRAFIDVHRWQVSDDTGSPRPLTSAEVEQASTFLAANDGAEEDQARMWNQSAFHAAESWYQEHGGQIFDDARSLYRSLSSTETFTEIVQFVMPQDQAIGRVAWILAFCHEALILLQTAQTLRRGSGAAESSLGAPELDDSRPAPGGEGTDAADPLGGDAVGQFCINVVGALIGTDSGRFSQPADWTQLAQTIRSYSAAVSLHDATGGLLAPGQPAPSSDDSLLQRWTEHVQQAFELVTHSCELLGLAHEMRVRAEEIEHDVHAALSALLNGYNADAGALVEAGDDEASGGEGASHSGSESRGAEHSGAEQSGSEHHAAERSGEHHASAGGREAGKPPPLAAGEGSPPERAGAPATAPAAAAPVTPEPAPTGAPATAPTAPEAATAGAAPEAARPAMTDAELSRVGGDLESGGVHLSHEQIQHVLEHSEHVPPLYTSVKEGFERAIAAVIAIAALSDVWDAIAEARRGRGDEAREHALSALANGLSAYNDLVAPLRLRARVARSLQSQGWAEQEAREKAEQLVAEGGEQAFHELGTLAGSLFIVISLIQTAMALHEVLDPDTNSTPAERQASWLEFNEALLGLAAVIPGVGEVAMIAGALILLFRIGYAAWTWWEHRHDNPAVEGLGTSLRAAALCTMLARSPEPYFPRVLLIAENDTLRFEAHAPVPLDFPGLDEWSYCAALLRQVVSASAGGVTAPLAFDGLPIGNDPAEYPGNIFWNVHMDEHGHFLRGSLPPAPRARWSFIWCERPEVARANIPHLVGDSDLADVVLYVFAFKSEARDSASENVKRFINGGESGFFPCGPPGPDELRVVGVSNPMRIQLAGAGAEQQAQNDDSFPFHVLGAAT